MSRLRSISTAIWSDPFIEDLSPIEKLLFIYLITNEKTNMLGIYEASLKKISFETGIKKQDVENALKGFETLKKVKYINNYVVLVNYLKHQNFNTNMKKSAIDVYNNLPKELKTKELNISKSNPSEGFETLLNHYGTVRKIEDEYEYEVEREDEVKIESKTPLSKIKILDLEDSLKNYFEIALAFQQLFIKNLKEKNAPTKNQEKATFGNYVTPIRLMFESDGITKEQLTQVYKFLDSHEGEFWKPNILSIKKLREKFQKLVAKANTTNGKSSNNTSTEPRINRQTISEIKSNASGWGVETPS